jgi:hypothetical protein
MYQLKTSKHTLVQNFNEEQPQYCKTRIDLPVLIFLKIPIKTLQKPMNSVQGVPIGFSVSLKT